MTLQKSEVRENSSANDSNIRLSAAGLCILNYPCEKTFEDGQAGRVETLAT
jgi:hypothetical protein